MYWQRLAASAACGVVAAAALSAPAAAQDDGEPVREVPADAPTATLDNGGPLLEVDEDAPAGTYEIGGYLGLRGGARLTPGGFSLGGTFLYRVASGVWSDSSVGVTLAGTEPGCFVERDGGRYCDHGVFGGSGLSMSSGVRVFFAENQSVTPYARAGLGLEYIAYGDDNLDGLAVPAFLGAGVRAQVEDRVFVGGAALAQAGFAFFDQSLGAELYASLTIMATVEFDLD